MGHRMGSWKQISNHLNSLGKSGLKFHKSRVDKGLSKQNIPSSLTGNFGNTLKENDVCWSPEIAFPEDLGLKLL